MRLIIRRLNKFNAVEATKEAQVLPKDAYLFDLENRHSAGVKNVVRAYADNPITDIQIVHRADSATEVPEEAELKKQGYTTVSYFCPAEPQTSALVDVNNWAFCTSSSSRVRFFVLRDTKIADPLVALSLLPFESAFVLKTGGEYVPVEHASSVLGKRAPLGSARQIQVGHPAMGICEIDDLITETSFESPTWTATFCESAAGAFEDITTPVSDLFNAMPQALQDRALKAGGGETVARERLAEADSQAADQILAYMNAHKADRETAAIQLHSFELVCNRENPAKLVWKRLLRSPYILGDNPRPHHFALQPFLWTLRRLNVPPLPNTAVLAERSLVFAKDFENCQAQLQEAQQRVKAADAQRAAATAAKKQLAKAMRRQPQPQQDVVVAAPQTSPEQLLRQTIELQCERRTMQLTAAATAAAAKCEADQSQLRQEKQSAETQAQQCGRAKVELEQQMQAKAAAAAAAAAQCDTAKGELRQQAQTKDAAAAAAAALCDTAKGELQQQVQAKDAAVAAQRLPPALQDWPSHRTFLRNALVVNKKPVGADRTTKFFGEHVTAVSLTADCTQLQWTSDK